MNSMNAVAANDLRACIRLNDERRAQNAAARTACQRNADLVTHLQAEAARRGASTIDWAEYFRNVGL